jgi:hypothetical protein
MLLLVAIVAGVNWNMRSAIRTIRVIVWRVPERKKMGTENHCRRLSASRHHDSTILRRAVNQALFGAGGGI